MYPTISRLHKLKCMKIYKHYPSWIIYVTLALRIGKQLFFTLILKRYALKLSKHFIFCIGRPKVYCLIGFFYALIQGIRFRFNHCSSVDWITIYKESSSSVMEFKKKKLIQQTYWTIQRSTTSYYIGDYR